MSTLVHDLYPSDEAALQRLFALYSAPGADDEPVLSLEALQALLLATAYPLPSWIPNRRLALAEYALSAERLVPIFGEPPYAITLTELKDKLWGSATSPLVGADVATLPGAFAQSLEQTSWSQCCDGFWPSCCPYVESRPLMHIPGRSGPPVIGYTSAVGYHFTQYFDARMKEFGKMFRSRLYVTGPCVFLIGRGYIDPVFDETRTRKDFYLGPLSFWKGLGGGSLFSDTDVHNALKHMTVNLFRRLSTKLISLAQTVCERHFATWDAGTSAASGFKTILVEILMEAVAPGSAYEGAHQDFDTILAGVSAPLPISGEYTAALEAKERLIKALRNAGMESGNQYGFNDEQFYEQIALTLVVAGYGGVSVLLLSSVAEIANHAEDLETIKAEIEAHCPRTGSGDDLSFESLKKLEHLTACIKEAARLHPPVRLASAVARETFTHKGYEIPAGTVLIANLEYTQRDPKQFPEPNRFQASRFRGDKPADFSTAGAYVAFSGGAMTTSRRCPGQDPALYICKTLLTLFLRDTEHTWADKRFIWERWLFQEGKSPSGAMAFATFAFQGNAEPEDATLQSLQYGKLFLAEPLGRWDGQTDPGVYKVEIKTKEVFGSGTDAKVQIVLFGEGGRSTKVPLDLPWENDFENSDADAYAIRVADNEGDTLGAVGAVEFSNSGNGVLPDWMVEHVVVSQPGVSDDEVKIVANGWVQSEQDRIFFAGSHLLPGDTEAHLQPVRDLALRRARARYAYQLNPGVPAGVRGPYEHLTRDELFEADKAVTFFGYSMIGVVNTELSSGKFDDLEDYARQYTLLKGPPDVKERWRDDEEVGWQAIAGLHPCMLTALSAMPEGVNVTDAVLQGLLRDGKSLSDEMTAGRFFGIDYRFMSRFQPEDENSKYMPSSFILLYVNGKETLVVVAVQIGEDVYTSKDDTWDWLTAKTYAINPDVVYHEVVAHYLQTHAVMEPFAVSAHRQLSSAHPVYYLLIPHLRYTMAINVQARMALVNPGGVVEDLCSSGSNSLKIAAHAYESWSFDQVGLPEDLAKRGMAETPALPDYPYRDDGLMLWGAIAKFVQGYIHATYESDEAVQGDHELQAWRKEIVTVGHNGRPFAGGEEFSTRGEVADWCTRLIWLSSAQHAAVNFGQWDYDGYVPNRPLSLFAPPPPRGTASEKTLVEALPDREQAGKQLSITAVLSKFSPDEVYIGTRPHFEIEGPPAAVEAFEAFQKELGEVEAAIDERNSKRRLPYVYLKPSRVPNSIAV